MAGAPLGLGTVDAAGYGLSGVMQLQPSLQLPVELLQLIGMLLVRVGAFFVPCDTIVMAGTAGAAV